MQLWYLLIFLGLSFPKVAKGFANFLLTFSFSRSLVFGVFFVVLSLENSLLATFLDVRSEAYGSKAEGNSFKLFQFKFFYKSSKPFLILVSRS